MWTRRDVVVGGTLSILWGGLPCACGAAERHDRNYGCTLKDDEVQTFFASATDTGLYINGSEPMIPKSGNKDFDLALAMTLAKISDILGATPGFAYYDDYDGLNAYATPRVRLNGADGTVLFGQRLLVRLMSGADNPDLSVAAVCAHEFGHILQYKHRLDEIVGAGQPTVKRIELQADFFAGYFAGVRKLDRPSFPAAVFAQTQFNFGDNMVNNKGHHGTPDERAAAIVKGFETAFRDKKPVGEAIDVSTRYVQTL